MLTPARTASEVFVLVADACPPDRTPYLSLSALADVQSSLLGTDEQQAVQGPDGRSGVHHNGNKRPRNDSNSASSSPRAYKRPTRGFVLAVPRSRAAHTAGKRSRASSSTSVAARDIKEDTSASRDSTRWKRILSHTFKLNPYFEEGSIVNGIAEAELYPASVAIDLDWDLTMHHGDRVIGLVEVEPCSDFFMGNGHYAGTRNWLTSAIRLSQESTGLRMTASLHRTLDEHAIADSNGHPNDVRIAENGIQNGNAPSSELGFHFELRIEVSLDLNQFAEMVQARDGQREQLATLLHHAFVVNSTHRPYTQDTEARTGKTYASTDIEWFYSALRRPDPKLDLEVPTVKQEDRKGKGRAVVQDEAEMDDHWHPPGLVPSLLPFQKRSVKWMLGREGRTVASVDPDGEVKLADHDASSHLIRGSLWQKLRFDDGDEVWFDPLTIAISHDDPAQSDKPIEGSIAGEEMGLGKTVEVLSLILLNKDPDRRLQPSYLVEKSGSMVQPSGQTLLVCPQAIISQWQDEIERHAPSLRVLRYEGINKTFKKKVATEQIIRDYDIVLCTFDVLKAEVAIARKPVIHTTRGNSHKPEWDRISYDRSLLVSVDWLRVVIDEAQMAASTTSAISETASLIPRRYSWAVSGTPIKQTIDDLSGLLMFLRVENVDDSPLLFERLLKPSYVEVFTRLVGRIGIRTTKAQIAEQLVLPDQQRYIVPVSFSAVERFNYRNRYNDAFVDLGLATEAVALHKDWTLDSWKMSRWLHWLRQACFHAQAGAPQVRPGQAQAANRAANAGIVQTLDEVLYNLRDRNIADLHIDQRAAANARVQRAYRLMYDKEECERFENALSMLKGARRDLHDMAEDIHREMLLIMPEVGRTSPTASRSSSTAGGQSYLTAFKETVKEMIEAAREDDDEKAKDRARRVGLLTTRLRETLIVMHAAVFFIGNAYFAMGDKEEEETKAYADAEILRKQILSGEEAQTMKVIRRMQDRLRAKHLGGREITFAYTDEEPGIQTAQIFDNIADLTDQANAIGKLVLEWRKWIIDALSSRLTDEEISAEEYQTKAENQEKLDIYIEFYARICADWNQIITGNRSTLADTPTVGGSTNTGQIEAAPAVINNVSRRSLYKNKAGMSSTQAAAIVAAADPASRLRVELEQKRREVVPKKMDDFLRNQLRQLSHLRERVLRETELEIIAEESKRLRQELGRKDRIIEQLNAEQQLFANVYNSRVAFYRQMQEFSDSVAELSPEDATPYALHKAMSDLRKRENELERSMLQKIARRRFLDSLKNKNQEEEVCLICSDTENGQIVLTHCGHLYHEGCLRTWSSKSHSHSCPVCRASLAQANAWSRVQLKGDQDSGRGVKKENEVVTGSLAEGASSSKSAASTSTTNGSTGGRSSQRQPALEALENVFDVSDVSKQLNYLPPEEVEAIEAVQLQGAALSSKLDMVVKHVLYLRAKHAKAIEKENDTATDVDTRHGSSAWPSTSSAFPGTNGSPERKKKGKKRAQQTTTTTEAKVLIYSGWQYACDVLARAFSREGVGFVRLESSAGNSAKTKDKAVIEFKEDPDVAVFILHAQSQAAGLNLTAAQYVIIVEPLLQVALEVQAIARVHRIGQKQQTTVFEYIIPATVDERIALLSLHHKGHTLFSRKQDQSSMNAPSVPMASSSGGGVDGDGSPSRKRKHSGFATYPWERRRRRRFSDPRRRSFAWDSVDRNSVGEDGASQVENVDDNDLARLLLEKPEFQALQRILIERARRGLD